MKLVILTSHGELDKKVATVPQIAEGVEVSEFDYTDGLNFSPRLHSFTTRMQAKIPKCFGWQMVPGADVYLWVDGSFALLNPHAVQWFLDHLGYADAAFFAHPWRKTVWAEVEFLKDALRRWNPYVFERYDGEWLLEQWKALEDDKGYTDDCLYCGGAFIYRNDKPFHRLAKEWWYQISRFHINDQLGLPYAMKVSGAKIATIPGDIFNCEYLTHTRNRKWKREHADA